MRPAPPPPPVPAPGPGAPAPRPDISTSTSVHHVDPIHDVKVIRIAPRHVVVNIGPVTFHLHSIADVSALADSLSREAFPFP